VAHDWQKHPGNIIEWQSSTGSSHEGSHYYSAAAGTMGSAIIKGFFGVELAGAGLTLQPRLGLNDGYIRVYQPATDRYAAYTYDWDQDIIQLNYGTNAAGGVTIKVLKLRSEQISQVTVDDRSIEFETETIGHDTYTVITAPSGEHSVEIIKGQPLVQPAAVEVTVAPEPSVSKPEPPLSVADNPVSPPDIPAPSNPAESGSEADLAAELEVSVETALEPAEFETLVTPASSDSVAARNARENRRAFFRFTGGSLVILICLELMVVLAIRRRAGLS
jgi:hypothetical protein